MKDFEFIDVYLHLLMFYIALCIVCFMMRSDLKGCEIICYFVCIRKIVTLPLLMRREVPRWFSRCIVAVLSFRNLQRR